jgi:hypothetical protein
MTNTNPRKHLINKAGNVRVNVTLRRVRETTVTVEKQCVTYSEYVFIALFIQHAMPMSHIVLLSEACPTLPYLPTLFHKQHSFRERLLNVQCLLFSLQILSETFLIPRTGRDIIMTVHRSSCKVLVLIFSTNFV